MDKKSRTIICTAFCNGKKHDFKLFQESKLHVVASSKVLVDSGYTGIKKIHSNVEVPKKRTKKRNSPEKKKNKTEKFLHKE